MTRWVALVGYMGAGKSTVGSLVAERLGCGFVDCDEAIEEFAGLRIPEIFSQRGEVWFRRTEERVIRDLLAGEPAVLSLGGGAVESLRSRDLLTRTAFVAWLRLDPERSWERVSGSDRPLAQDRARFLRRASQREASYRAVAHEVVDAAADPTSVAELVIEAATSSEEVGA